MGWSDDIVTTYLDKDILLPAIGQGALGIECRSDDVELLELLSKVHNQAVAIIVTVLKEHSFQLWMVVVKYLLEGMQLIRKMVKLNLLG